MGNSKVNKLSKKEEEQLHMLRGKLISAKAEHDALLAELNNKIQSLVKEFNSSNELAMQAIKAKYIEAANEFKQFSVGIVSQMESYAEARSDKWHDGESGFNYYQWIEEWQSISSDMDEAEFVDLTVEVNLNWLPEPIEPTVKPYK